MNSQGHFSFRLVWPSKGSQDVKGKPMGSLISPHQHVYSKSAVSSQLLASSSWFWKHVFNPSTWQAKAGGSLRVQGQPRLHSETFLQKWKRKFFKNHKKLISSQNVIIKDLESVSNLCIHGARGFRSRHNKTWCRHHCLFPLCQEPCQTVTTHTRAEEAPLRMTHWEKADGMGEGFKKEHCFIG